MPTRAERICPQPGCIEPRPCEKHTPKPWAKSTRRERIGTSGWQQQRDAHRILARDGHTCCQCGAPATIADHIIPVAQGGPDTDDNKQALCQRCSNTKTAAESQAGRTR